MKKILEKTIRFLFDTAIAYTWAFMLFIPFFNTLVLRAMMKDSIAFNKQLNEGKRNE